MPSDHPWSTFLLPIPPQFLNQVPPGAQQLTLPDFLNVPHLGHVIVLAIVARTISSRLRVDLRRAGYRRVGSGAQVSRDIDPDEPSNMPSLLALELTQASPQRFFLKDVASANM